jgi:hypothetical protein
VQLQLATVRSAPIRSPHARHEPSVNATHFASENSTPLTRCKACSHVGCAVVFFRKPEPALVRAQSAGEPKAKKMVRRHSTGDHAFLPNRQERDAVKQANKNFGVPGHLVQDSEVRYRAILPASPPRMTVILLWTRSNLLTRLSHHVSGNTASDHARLLACTLKFAEQTLR